MGLALGMTLKFYSTVTKRLKLKVRKFLGATSNVCRSYRGKTGRGPFRPSILNRVNKKYVIPWRCNTKHLHDYTLGTPVGTPMEYPCFKVTPFINSFTRFTVFGCIYSTILAIIVSFFFSLLSFLVIYKLLLWSVHCNSLCDWQHNISCLLLDISPDDIYQKTIINFKVIMKTIVRF